MAVFMFCLISFLTGFSIAYMHFDFKIAKIITRHKIAIEDTKTEAYINGYKTGKADTKREMKMFYSSGNIEDSRMTIYGHPDYIREVTNNGVKINEAIRD